MKGDVHINCTDAKSIEQGFIFLAREIAGLKNGIKTLTMLTVGQGQIAAAELENEWPGPFQKNIVKLIDQVMANNESSEMIAFIRELLGGPNPVELVKLQLAKAKESTNPAVSK